MAIVPKNDPYIFQDETQYKIIYNNYKNNV